jgi:hypothetical protein
MEERDGFKVSAQITVLADMLSVGDRGVYVSAKGVTVAVKRMKATEAVDEQKVRDKAKVASCAATAAKVDASDARVVNPVACSTKGRRLASVSVAPMIVARCLHSAST